jgi:hypothetical protein
MMDANMIETKANSATILDLPPLSALPVEHLCDLSVELERPTIIPTPGARWSRTSAKGGAN